MRPAVRLSDSHHDVGAVLSTPVTLAEQRAGRAGPRRIAQVYSQTPASRFRVPVARSPQVPARHQPHVHPGTDGGTIIPETAGPRRPPGGQAAAQSRAVGCDQPAPHTVLADIPMPQRQHQALAPDQATGADRDRSGGLLARPGRIHADREPLVRVKPAISTSAIPDHLGRQSTTPRRSGCGGGVVTPSRVPPESTIRARGRPGEAVMCSLLLRRLPARCPASRAGIRRGSGGQLPSRCVQTGRLLSRRALLLAVIPAVPLAVAADGGWPRCPTVPGGRS